MLQRALFSSREAARRLSGRGLSLGNCLQALPEPATEAGGEDDPLGSEPQAALLLASSCCKSLARPGVKRGPSARPLVVLRLSGGRRPPARPATDLVGCGECPPVAPGADSACASAAAGAGSLCGSGIRRRAEPSPACPLAGASLPLPPARLPLASPASCRRRPAERARQEPGETR